MEDEPDPPSYQNVIHLDSDVTKDKLGNSEIKQKQDKTNAVGAGDKISETNPTTPEKSGGGVDIFSLSSPAAGGRGGGGVDQEVENKYKNNIMKDENKNNVNITEPGDAEALEYEVEIDQVELQFRYDFNLMMNHDERLGKKSGRREDMEWEAGHTTFFDIINGIDFLGPTTLLFAICLYASQVEELMWFYGVALVEVVHVLNVFLVRYLIIHRIVIFPLLYTVTALLTFILVLIVATYFFTQSTLSNAYWTNPLMGCTAGFMIPRGYLIQLILYLYYKWIDISVIEDCTKKPPGGSDIVETGTVGLENGKLNENQNEQQEKEEEKMSRDYVNFDIAPSTKNVKQPKDDEKNQPKIQ